MFSKSIFMMMVTGEGRGGGREWDREVHKLDLITHESVREVRELYSSPTTTGGDSAW